jgi:transcriptional regulator with XRE-family HTH domain
LTSRAPDDKEKFRPSEVFARRLRETRKARGITQEALAEMLTGNGIPMSKTALLGIERAADQDRVREARSLSLDEALAIAAVLNAAPSNMLAPPEGSIVQITDGTSTDSLGFREFLRYGFPWSLDAVPYEYLPDEDREKFVFELARLALTMSDACRAGDKAGIREAGEAIIDRVKQREGRPPPRALTAGRLTNPDATSAIADCACPNPGHAPRR